MNRLLSITSIIIFIAASCKSSCRIGTYGNDKPTSDVSNGIQIYSGGISRILVSSDLDTGHVEMLYEFYIKTDSAYQDSVNYMISDFVQLITEFEGEDFVSPLTPEYFETQADSFVHIYQNLDGENEGPPWDMMCDISIDDHYTSFVEVSFSEWSYTGGAHGNGFYALHMIDKLDGRKLDLEDFFSSIDTLNTIAESYFRKMKYLDPSDDLREAGFWFDQNKFSVNNNFSFDAGVLTFHYNAYEIAPYSSGATDLEIPINEIKHLLKRDV